jgi:Flp pilus assembly protein TadD
MKRPAVLVGVLIALATLALYWPVLDHGFLLLDDEGYVTRNREVLGGLTRDGVAWAFTSVGRQGNWHPLAWLSHMLDVQLFGLDARGHHAVSALLHAANALLVFALLRSLTGAPWRAAAVALLFAVHPLHVESVAWVAERKDVLSAFFSLLTLLAYVRYARRPTAPRLLGTLALFALALLAKPMAVTLPFVMLLLDFWPLGRAAGLRGTAADAGSSAADARTPIGRLFLEKAPFLALSAASAVVTWLAQLWSGSLTPVAGGVATRAGNAVVSYVVYVAKTLWPVKLAAFYPYPQQGHPAWAAAGAALALLAATAGVVRAARRQPWLAAGWFWFLGMLVPVIGFVQVGGQAMADRYTYLPLCGLFVMAAWSAGDALRRRPQWRPVAVAGAVLLVPLALATRAQIATWRDDVTLGRHALAVTRDNWFLENNLGLALAQQGHGEEAVAHLRESVRVRPDYDRAWSNLGVVLNDLGRHDEAAAALSAALRVNPLSADAHYNLAITLSARGDLRGAEQEYRAAVQADPGNADALTNLGELLLRQRRYGEAIEVLGRSLAVNPGDAFAHVNLGLALETTGRRDDAVGHYRQALALQPDLAIAARHLERALRTRGPQ